MNFVVEVPGEAQPLNAQELCRVLESATASSTLPPQRQAAGQQLAAWEAHEGYYSSLQVRTSFRTETPCTASNIC
jgi:hypothetical protein